VILSLPASWQKADTHGGLPVAPLSCVTIAAHCFYVAPSPESSFGHIQGVRQRYVNCVIGLAPFLYPLLNARDLKQRADRNSFAFETILQLNAFFSKEAVLDRPLDVVFPIDAVRIVIVEPVY
jgi:hypothetical protein